MKPLRKIRQFFYKTHLGFKCRHFPEEMHTICVNGLELAYAIRGPKEGRPVVLLHGNGGSHNSMATQAKELALAGYLVYSPDNRGQGANTPLDEYHYADMAEDTVQFISALGLKKPAAYGWSDGGIIALMAEMAHPGTFGLFAISGANITPDCGPGFEKFKEWILSVNTPVVLMMLNEPNIDPAELSSIKCPVLVTAGDLDLISVEHTTLIADSIPESELIILKGEDHSSFIKKSPKMGRYLLDFLSRHGY